MDVNSTDTEAVRVAILDTGVNAAHPEFQNEITGSGRVRMWKGFPERLDPLSDHTGHGTHVASVI